MLSAPPSGTAPQELPADGATGTSLRSSAAAKTPSAEDRATSEDAASSAGVKAGEPCASIAEKYESASRTPR